MKLIALRNYVGLRILKNFFPYFLQWDHPTDRNKSNALISWALQIGTNKTYHLKTLEKYMDLFVNHRVSVENLCAALPIPLSTEHLGLTQWMDLLGAFAGNRVGNAISLAMRFQRKRVSLKGADRGFESILEIPPDVMALCRDIEKCLNDNLHKYPNITVGQIELAWGMAMKNRLNNT